MRIAGHRAATLGGALVAATVAVCLIGCRGEGSSPYGGWSARDPFQAPAPPLPQLPSTRDRVIQDSGARQVDGLLDSYLARATELPDLPDDLTAASAERAFLDLARLSEVLALYRAHLDSPVAAARAAVRLAFVYLHLGY